MRRGCWNCVFVIVTVGFTWEAPLAVAEHNSVLGIREWTSLIDQVQRVPGFEW